MKKSECLKELRNAYIKVNGNKSSNRVLQKADKMISQCEKSEKERECK